MCWGRGSSLCAVLATDEMGCQGPRVEAEGIATNLTPRAGRGYFLDVIPKKRHGRVPTKDRFGSFQQFAAFNLDAN